MRTTAAATRTTSDGASAWLASRLDTFRSFVFESSFLEKFEIPSEELEELKTNDEALLRFAFKWLRFAMFAEPTMKVREEAVDRSTT